MTRDAIPGWVDRQGRLWLDTGVVKDEEVVIQLINGEASGTFSWIDREVGPLKRPNEL